MASRQFRSDYRPLLLCVGLALILSACSISADITLKEDGSAKVIAPCAYPDSMLTWAQIYASQRRFFNSSQISELQMATDSLHMMFNIKTIDSLGNYLFDGLNKDYLKFEYRQDTLTITESDGPALKNKHAYDCCSFYISITSQRTIKNIQTSNSFVRQDGNTVHIAKKGRQFKKGKKKINILIVYE